MRIKLEMDIEKSGLNRNQMSTSLGEGDSQKSQGELLHQLLQEDRNADGVAITSAPAVSIILFSS